MRYFLPFFLGLFFLVHSTEFLYGQNAILFQDDFENGNSTWMLGSIVGENSWNIGSCAGNGSTSSGDSAVYVTTGSNVACGEEFSYTPSGSTSSIIVSQTIDATCASANLRLNFDYQSNLNAGCSFELIYSVDGGNTWSLITTLTNQSVWFTSSGNVLPAALVGTTFQLGFRFNYDNSLIGAASPPAIDNVIVTGEDNIPPSLNCPASDTIHSDPIVCLSGLGKMNDNLISLSDNCTDSANIIFIQTPPETYTLNGHLDNVLVNIIVEDQAGNQSTCDINVVMVDVTPPTTVCPSDTTQYLDVNCATALGNYNNYVLTNSTDNCGLGTSSQLPLPGAPISGAGTIQNVVMTVTDAAGNQATCNFNVTFIDSIAPTLNCPDSLPMYLNISCEGVVPDYTNYIAQNAAHDSCSASGTITATQDLVAGTFLFSNQAITYIVTDANGNSSTCQTMLVLTDTIKPQIACAASSYSLNAVSACSAPLPNYTVVDPPATSDNCGGTVTVTQNPAPGTPISGINNHVYLIATDTSGNIDSCSFTVSINDVTNPTIICPNDTVIPSDQFCQGQLLDFTYLAEMNDNCTDTFSLSQNFTQNPVAGITITGTTPITVTLTANDNSGNSASCNLQVGLIDLTPPQIDTILPFTTNTNVSSCDYTLPDYTTSATAHDNCTADANINLTQIPAPGTTLVGTGTHSFMIVAEDNAGNKDTLNVNFTVQDNVLPTVSSCPGTQTIYSSTTCVGNLGDYTNLIAANDNCTANGNLTITQTPAPTATISNNTSVTITVSDQSGNTNNTCSFTVLLADTTDPQIICPSDSSVTVDAICNYNIPDFVAVTVATDNCDASPTITQSPIAGSASSGTTLVTLSTVDAAGNTSTCQVQVLPIIPPISITSCATNQTLSTSSCSQIIGNYTGLVTVNTTCSGINYTQIPVAGTSLSTGNHIIQIVAEDPNGNADTCSFNLLITENIPPTIICPNDTTSCAPIVNYIAPAGSDNCVAITMQTDLTGLSSGSIFPVGVTTLEYTVADSSGNTASCTFDITILDYPDTALVMADTAICDSKSLLISAIAPNSGTGEWTVINGGTATINNQFASTSGVNNLQYGANTFVWNVSSASCGSNTDTLTVRVDEMPNPSASTLEEMASCETNAIEITGNNPIVGYGFWHDVNGNATFSDSTTVPTTVADLQPGWNYIVWSIGNGVCPITRDTIDIFVQQNAQILTNADSIGALCASENTVTVMATPLQNGFSSIWYISQGNGDVAAPNANQTLINNLGIGQNLIIYKLSSPYCDDTFDSLIVVVDNCNDFGNNFPTMITPNGDGKNDLWVLDNLQIAYPQCKVNIFDQWGNVVFKSTGYSNPWDGKYKNKPLPMGTYFYVIETSGTDNKVYKGHLSIIH